MAQKTSRSTLRRHADTPTRFSPRLPLQKLRNHLRQPVADPLYQRDLAKICNNFGYYHQLNGDPTQARAFCERARQLCETLVATDPSPNNRQDLALSCFRLGEVLSRRDLCLFHLSR